MSYGLSSCKKDYYTNIVEAGTCGRELTEDCYQAIVSNAPLDLESFVDHPGAEQRVVKAIHLLLTAPIAFPEDKKIFGLGTWQEAGMNDFYQRFVKEPTPSINQAILNYIFNAAQEIRYECNSVTGVSFYTPEAIHVCFTEQQTKNISDETQEKNLIMTVTLLFHEARHSETGQHQVYVPSSTPLVPRGDVGLDGPFGWEAALLWGFFHGNDQAKVPYFDRDTLKKLIDRLQTRFGYIFAPPEVFLPPVSQKTFFQDYRRNFPLVESLHYPSMISMVVFPDKAQSFTSEVEKVTEKGFGKDIDHNGTLDLVVVGEKEIQVLFGSTNRTLEGGQKIEMEEEITNVDFLDHADPQYRGLVITSIEKTYFLPIAGKESSADLIEVAADVERPSILSVKIADLNRDGQKDLFYYFSDRSWGVRLGSQNPREFHPLTLWGWDAEDLLQDSVLHTLSDINQDGYEDLIFCSQTSVILGLGASGQKFHFQKIDPFSQDSTEARAFFLFYLGQGQKYPLISINESAVTELAGKKGPFFIQTMNALPVPISQEPMKKSTLYSQTSGENPGKNINFAVDDFTGDGYPEILSSQRTYNGVQIKIFTSMNGEGYLDKNIPLLNAESSENTFLSASPIVGDFNGDGYKDIAVLTSKKQVFIFFHEGKESPSYTW